MKVFFCQNIKNSIEKGCILIPAAFILIPAAFISFPQHTHTYIYIYIYIYIYMVLLQTRLTVISPVCDVWQHYCSTDLQSSLVHKCYLTMMKIPILLLLIGSQDIDDTSFFYYLKVFTVVQFCDSLII